MLSVFYALSHGKVVIVEPLVSSNPVLTLLLASIFLRDVEALSTRVILGALLKSRLEPKSLTRLFFGERRV